MNKSILEKFISKYHLSGQVESVSWQVDQLGGVSVGFVDEDRSMTGFLSADDIHLPSGKYDIYETVTFKSLLAVLGDDINISVESDNAGSPIAFVMKDGSTKVRFGLSDNTTIPVVPSIKGMPNFEVVIDIDPKFATTFIKASGALRDSETFTVISDGSQAQVVLGYSDNVNQNSVSIDVHTSVNGIISPVHFASKNLRDILYVNKEMTKGTMRVSSLGLIELELIIPDFKVKYYLMKTTVD